MSGAFSRAAAAIARDKNFAVDGTYTPQGGTAVELKASEGKGVIFRTAEETGRAFDTGFRRKGAKTALITQDSVSSRPSDGDTLAAGGKTFTIRQADPDSSEEWWELDLDEQQ